MSSHMKHAFLILAHNNFSSLKRLVSQLDHDDNDIFVHFDKKIANPPELTARSAGLFAVDDRIDVRWGDLSVVMAEFSLFRTALEHGPYARYHLLSGVDICLKDNGSIHDFFDRYPDREFIGYTLTELTPELLRKAGRWHLFPESFRDAPIWKKAIRHAFIRLQELVRYRRNKDVDLKKGSQWVSVTHAMATLFVSNREWVTKHFSHTFCSDEIVFQTLCWNSPFRNSIYSLENDGKGCARAISWFDGCMKQWSDSQIEQLAANPECQFARKYTNAASVSVLIPAYNAQATLPHTLDSILAQDYPHIEVCLVNDCSTDGTLAIIDRYRSRFEAAGMSLSSKSNSSNSGAAATRNSVLDLATGDYVMFVDADDTLLPGAVGKAVQLAEDSNSDITGWNWRLESDNTVRTMRQPVCPTPCEALKCLMAGAMRWNLWLFMFRRELFRDFRFTPGMDMGEDMLCVLSLMNRAERFAQTPDVLYSYVQTGASISRTMSQRNISQVTANVERFQEILLADNRFGIPPRFTDYLKLNIKLPLLVSENNDDYLCWDKWFSESNRRILSNTRLPLRTRLLECLAWWRMWPLVRLYNRMVYGFAYTRLFRKNRE